MELQLGEFKKLWRQPTAGFYYSHRAVEALTSAQHATTSADKLRHLGTVRLLVAFLTIQAQQLQQVESYKNLDVLKTPHTTLTVSCRHCGHEIEPGSQHAAEWCINSKGERLTREPPIS